MLVNCAGKQGKSWHNTSKVSARPGMNPTQTGRLSKFVKINYLAKFKVLLSKPFMGSTKVYWPEVY